MTTKATLKNGKNLVGLTILLLAAFLVSGCATNISKPSRAPLPAKVKFSKFDRVEMKTVTVAEDFAQAGANQKARKKIDEILFQKIQMVFPKVKRVGAKENFSDSRARTLQITPLIEEIKFVGGAARFMVGAMAGSSAVLMQVTFRDSASGRIIAEPEFYRSAGAYSGGYSIGASDNRMLEEIAQDVVQYSSLNK